ncbi:monooxygenase [Nitratireductor aestuarii]|uniref:Monooxygenase n=1 Tax=Nitratireductor aestuarii TaxID=1735103 RepID=A0A916RYK7_9HYPH|nr:NtaA/DmoA family FMN-dependent monooxygenase [Nitratireductor aestuarii]GGA73134.1 monooxygenase [Nitratireductor aestuarii]
MIFNLVVFGHGSHEAAWRSPEAQATAPLDLSHWTACAKLAEAAGFDGLFLGDILCLQDHPEVHPSEALDPLMVLAAVAGVTERLTLIGTASASFNHPFHLARRILSLHHLTRGRAGWNIVTSSYAQEAANFGWPKMPETPERYAHAEDVVNAVKALWDSWDGVTRVADKESGRWLNQAPQTVKREGRFGAINGALNLSPEPWSRPVLAQAGSSPEGLAFAARHADQVFTVQSDIGQARAFRERLHKLAVEAGRNPQDIKVLPGLVPFIGETREDAEAQLMALSAHNFMEHLVTKLERFTGLDLSGADLDAPLKASAKDLPRNSFSNSRARLLLEVAEREGLTLRQLAVRFAAGRGHLLFVGTAEELGRVMRDWIEAGACDGFNVMPPQLPVDLSCLKEQFEALRK